MREVLRVSVAVALLIAQVELVRWGPKLTNEPKSDGTRWHLRRRGDEKTFCGLAVPLTVQTAVAVGAVDDVCEHCRRARLRRLLAA